MAYSPATAPQINRRHLLAGLGGTVLISALPSRADEMPDQVRGAITELFGDRTPQPGRVTLKLPPIAENGYSVPLDVHVDSPMSEEDHVRRIVILSERNPLANVMTAHLGPRAGTASLSTRIRMAGTQEIVAVAEMSDGSLWIGGAETVVTLAACVVL